MTIQANTEDFTAPADESPEPVAAEATSTDAQVVGTLDPATGQATPVSTEVKVEPAEPAEKVKEGPTEEEITAAVDEVTNLIDSIMVGNPDRDAATGTLSDALVEQVRLAFGKLPGGNTKASARPRVRAYVDGKLAEAMNEGDMPAARSFYALQQEALVARGGDRSLTKVTDPTEMLVHQLTALWLAPYLAVVPEGVAEDWSEQVDALGRELVEPTQQYRVWLDANEDERGEEPEVHEVIRAAGRIARGKAARITRAKSGSGGGEASGAVRAAYTGTKRNVARHILQAFEGRPVGTVMSVGEIAKFKSDEYGDDKVSQGAVSARIWAEGGCTVDGIEAVMTADNPPKKAARKVAEPKGASA